MCLHGVSVLKCVVHIFVPKAWGENVIVATWETEMHFNYEFTEKWASLVALRHRNLGTQLLACVCVCSHEWTHWIQRMGSKQRRSEWKSEKKGKAISLDDIAYTIITYKISPLPIYLRVKRTINSCRWIKREVTIKQATFQLSHSLSFSSLSQQCKARKLKGKRKSETHW